MPSAPDPGLYDLFVSYSTKDNVPPPGEREGWVQVFVRRVRDLAVTYTNQNLATTADVEPGWDTFYAPDEIHAGQQWEARLRGAIAHTRVLLACLSPHYWSSQWCRIEWETYLENESARGLAHQEGGITPIYIASEPGVDAQAVIAAAPDWARQLFTARQVRLLAFETHGLDALARLKALSDDPATVKNLGAIAVRISNQIRHARRAEQIQPGNLAAGTDTFVGRGDELRALEHQLFGAGALGVITALRGLGGQGKTALALRYGQNLRSRYPGGCWQVIAEGRTELLPLVATLREPLGLAAVAQEDDAGTARRVLAELHRRAFDPALARGPGHPAAALLLVDNVDSPGLLAPRQREALRQAMVAAGLGGDPGWLHLLATTRLEATELSFLKAENIVRVEALSEADALVLWRKILEAPGRPLSPEELAAARQVIALLERHTLAVEIAARHIRRSLGETGVSYLARLRAALAAGPGRVAAALGDQQRPLQERAILPGHTHASAATLRFTFDHLAAEDPAAATALRYAAHFPAEAVPLPWLRLLAGQQHPELLEPAETPGLPTAWDRAELRLTESLRLLTHADGEHPAIARLHRLAGDFLRQMDQQAGADEARRAAVEGFIDHRCTLAEHDHRAPLQPWERAVLLSDLHSRMARPDCSTEMARHALLLGQILTAYADLATARRLTIAANAVQRRLAQSDPANAAWQRDLSVSLNSLGKLAVAQGDLAGALRSFTEAKAIAERLAQSDPANAEWQFDLGISNERLGDLAVQQGKLDEAVVFHTKRKDIIERLAQSDPANAAWQRDLSVSLNMLGELAVPQGDPVGALRSFTECHAILERLAQSDPANAESQRDLAVAFEKLGDVATAQEDFINGERYYLDGLHIAERLTNSDLERFK